MCTVYTIYTVVIVKVVAIKPSGKIWPLTSRPPAAHQIPVVELITNSLMSLWLLLLNSPVTHRERVHRSVSSFISGWPVGKQHEVVCVTTNEGWLERGGLCLFTMSTAHSSAITTLLHPSLLFHYGLAQTRENRCFLIKSTFIEMSSKRTF